VSTSTAGTLSATIFGASAGGQAITAGATSPNTNGTATGKAYLSASQTVWYTLTNSAGTPTLNAYIVGYDF
jgi:carboxylesterase type B